MAHVFFPKGSLQLRGDRRPVVLWGHAIPSESFLGRKGCTGAYSVRSHREDRHGAIGFSFGSPEFLTTGRSSVLPEHLRAFYRADDFNAMCEAWGDVKPSHQGGVLKDLGVKTVRTDKTIRSQPFRT